MAFTLVQFKVFDEFSFGDQVNTQAVTFDNPSTAGNLVVFEGVVNTNDALTLRNDKSDTITNSPIGFFVTDVTCFIAAAFVPTAGSLTYTVDWTNVTPGRCIAISEFSGLSAASWDQSAVNSGNNNPIDSGLTPTLTQALEIACGMMTTETGTPITADAPWINDYGLGGNTNTNFNHQFLSATTGINMSGNPVGNGAPWTSLVATLKGQTVINAPPLMGQAWT